MSNDELATHFLWKREGQEAIGKNYRQTVYLLSTNKLPARKIGATWIGTERSCVRGCLVSPEQWGRGMTVALKRPQAAEEVAESLAASRLSMRKS